MGFKPGVCFPAVGADVMEYRLHMLKGPRLYLKHDDWHEIWGRDLVWIGGYRPPQFYAPGQGDAWYLRYKHANRDVAL